MAPNNTPTAPRRDNYNTLRSVIVGLGQNRTTVAMKAKKATILADVHFFESIGTRWVEEVPQGYTQILDRRRRVFRACVRNEGVEGTDGGPTFLQAKSAY